MEYFIPLLSAVWFGLIFAFHERQQFGIPLGSQLSKVAASCLAGIIAYVLIGDLVISGPEYPLPFRSRLGASMFLLPVLTIFTSIIVCRTHWLGSLCLGVVFSSVIYPLVMTMFGGWGSEIVDGTFRLGTSDYLVGALAGLLAACILPRRATGNVASKGLPSWPLLTCAVVVLLVHVAWSAYSSPPSGEFKLLPESLAQLTSFGVLFISLIWSILAGWSAAILLGQSPAFGRISGFLAAYFFGTYTYPEFPAIVVILCAIATAGCATVVASIVEKRCQLGFITAIVIGTIFHGVIHTVASGKPGHLYGVVWAVLVTSVIGGVSVGLTRVFTKPSKGLS